MHRKLYINGNRGLSLAKSSGARATLTRRALYQVSLRLGNLSKDLEAFLIRRSLRAAGLSGIEGIPTYTNPRELLTLYKLAAACPPNARALEIGSHLGASSCHLAAGLAPLNGRLLCVDTWRNDAMLDGPEDTFPEFQANIAPLRGWIEPFRKHSKDLSTLEFDRPFNLIFIDGDHSYEAVRRDLRLVAPWLASGGTIAFHDFSHPNHMGVTRAVGEALASGTWLLGGIVDSLAWMKHVSEHTPRIGAPATDTMP